MSGPPIPVLEMAAELCERYQIADLRYFLESCRAFARAGTLNIAIFGRFKAGKSSFLNHLLGAPLLPVGVVPVTSVITEIGFSPQERAEVRFLDGHAAAIAPTQIAEYVSETANPANVKQVAAVQVELPAMERYRGICFVDTPGLDSVFAHNTDASTEWLPNTGLALVAVGADAPLSAHDIELIRDLSRFTPNISVLLTKVDTLAPDERTEVEGFVRAQLGRYWNGAVPVYPYSIRPGFESLRERLEQQLLARARAGAGEQHAAILRHKSESLAAECRGYLEVALKAAEAADSDREQLRERVVGQKESLDDTRLALRLAARHAAAGARAKCEEILRRDEAPVRQRLLDGLEREFPAWTRSLSVAMERFDEWLRAGVTREMAALSRQHRGEFLEPARRASRQLSQCLQDFRNRLAKQAMETLGVPLETTQVELTTQEPRSPDIRVGRIFDHNWELVSAAVPMSLLQVAVKRHFERRVADVVFMNLSRLASQWEEAAGGALVTLERDSIGRLDTLIATIEKLIASAGRDTPRIREDLRRLRVSGA
ncbi:MAG: dynamin family protein [Bryobacteraceae bacterium]|jgi:GTP-binding protein EngB required for normal cell division